MVMAAYFDRVFLFHFLSGMEKTYRVVHPLRSLQPSGRTERNSHFATTPTFAIVAPLVIDGTAQTYKHNPSNRRARFKNHVAQIVGHVTNFRSLFDISSALN